MICKHCHHEIGPEDLKCPFCGEENPFAKRHQENMKAFDRKYKKTRREVLAYAGRVKGLGKKAAVLTVLLLGIIVMIIIASVNYAEPNTDGDVENDAIRHAKKYCGQIETFLENGEYMECMSFMYSHGIQNSSAEAYKKYRQIKYAAQYYYECIQYMEMMIFRSPDPDYFDSLDQSINGFSGYLEEFYSTLENMKAQEKNEKYLACLEDMDQELKLAMKIYFHMDDKELEEFLKLSQAKRAVRIEEVFSDEE